MDGVSVTDWNGMQPQHKKWLDIASMGLSALCVVHCLALPFVAAVLPFLGLLSNSDWVHPLLVLIAAPLSLWAILSSGAWRRWQVSAPVAAGLTLLALAAFVPALEPVEVLISVAGALLIAAAHLMNYLRNRPLHVHTATCDHAEGMAGD